MNRAEQETTRRRSLSVWPRACAFDGAGMARAEYRRPYALLWRKGIKTGNAARLVYEDYRPRIYQEAKQ